VDAPTGTVALVFTDVQGSTAIWEHGPVLMRAALAIHDAVMRRTLAAAGGYEVKTEGDAFMVVFGRATDAVTWCQTVQLHLLEAPWPEDLAELPDAAVTGDPPRFRGLRVRMGVHVGEPDCRPDPVTGRMDYFGPVVNRAARVSSAGHGGQILVSEAALAASASALIDSTVIDLGEHRLKGLVAAEHLFQVLPARLAERTFPPVRTVAAPRTNLTPSANAMLGRADELERVGASFGTGARLVTVVGPGGSGKTRLVREHALTHVADYRGGTWFVDLSQARGESDVQSTVAGALGVALPPGASAEAATAVLGRALAARDHLLFILDNLEQIISTAAPALHAWLEAAPRAAFLVTSRQPLGLSDEITVELGALDEDAAIHLLLERAAKVGATLDPIADRPALRELAERLDRLPLALELAAPRLRALTPAQLTARLTQGIDLLRRVARDVPERHASLRAAIAASWDLLDATERAAIGQCAVFPGSFTIEAAEDVIVLDDDAPPVLDVVLALRDKSLFATIRAPGAAPRFVIYGAVRQFLDDVADPELVAEACDRHARHFVATGERLVRESIGPRAPEAFAELGREIDNLRAVLARAAAAHPGLAVRAALCLEHALTARGPGALRAQVLDAGLTAAHACRNEHNLARIHIARARFDRLRGELARAAAELDQAAAFIPADDPLASPLAYERAYLARLAGQHDLAAELLDRALAAAHDDAGRALVLDGRAALAQDRSRLADAEADVRAAIDAAARAGDVRLEARLRQNLGAIRHDAGDLDGADEAYRAALDAVRGLGDARLEGVVLANLGNLLGDRGRTDEARALIDSALPLLAAAGDAAFAAHAHMYRGLVALRAGRAADGRADLDKARVAHAAAGARRFEALDRGYLAIAAALAGAWPEATARFAEAMPILTEFADDHMRIYFAACAAAVARHVTGAPGVNFGDVERLGLPPWLVDSLDHLAGAPAAPADTTHAALAAALAR
jgi:predicted ATPase/class 3 adenylate cyclase